MAKPAGPLCNLNCTYCFYNNKTNLYPRDESYILPYDILELFIKKYISEQDNDVISFTWQGGEPLLPGLEYYRKVLELQSRYAEGKQIENSIQTNGILLDDDWCKFFHDNNFLVGISVDGPEHLHNKFRMNRNLQPSFNKVMRGLECLKKYNVDFNTLTVVHSYNSMYPSEVYLFLKQIGSRYIQLIPLVESPASVIADLNVQPEQYGKFLCRIFDEWITNDVGEYFIQIFDAALESWLGLNSTLCLFSYDCSRNAVLEHNGDVYSCDHFVFPAYHIGNIRKDSLHQIMNSETQRVFGTIKGNLPEYCLSCEVLFACKGECPKNRFSVTHDGEYGLNYLCNGYKDFFTYINPYMKYMANELLNKRAPANIMSFIKTGGFYEKQKELHQKKIC